VASDQHQPASCGGLLVVGGPVQSRRTMPPADVVELPARGDHGLACLFAINHPNTRSDSQPKSGRCNLPRNLSPDVATFTRTRHSPPRLSPFRTRPDTTPVYDNCLVQLKNASHSSASWGSRSKSVRSPPKSSISTLQFRRLDRGSERVIRAEDAADGLAEPVGRVQGLERRRAACPPW
jgi:hypothetical protein